MNNLRGKYAIAGVGHSKLGKVPEMGPIGMFAVAARNAIADAGLTKEDVDGLITTGAGRRVLPSPAGGGGAWAST